MKTVRTLVWKGDLDGARPESNLLLLIVAGDVGETILELRRCREDEALESDRRQMDRDEDANMTTDFQPARQSRSARNVGSSLVHESLLLPREAIENQD
jgi:hypothetical protein